MVMKNVMGKNLFRSIIKSLGRYIAIVAIIALGAGLFVGLLATKSDMIATGQEYLDDQNMFDLRLLNPYGWTNNELEQIKSFDQVVDAEPYITMDIVGNMGQGGTESVYLLTQIPEKINKLSLRGGRMPSAPNECLADGLHANDSIIGQKFTVSMTNDTDSLDSLTVNEFTVVGYANSPLYMDMTRGSTKLGNGSISALIFVMPGVIEVDSYTQIDITIPGEYGIYTEEYNEALETASDEIKPLLSPLVEARYSEVRAEAEKEYNDGLSELESGIAEYEQGRIDALQELSSARTELETNEADILVSEKNILDGRQQLDDAQELLDNSALELSNSKSLAYEQLLDASSALLENSTTVQTNLNTVNSALIEVESGLAQIDTGITQLNFGITQLNISIELTNTLISSMDAALIVAQNALNNAQLQGQLDPDVLEQLQQRVDDLFANKSEYELQLQQLQADLETYSSQLQDLQTQKLELENTKAELESSKIELEAAMEQIQLGYKELDNSKLLLEAQFAAAEASILNAQSTLDSQQKELDKGLKALEDGKIQLEDGWKAYWDGIDEFNRKMSEAQLEIARGRADLAEAQDLIDSMEFVDAYILDRNTNIGYLALDNNSDIVAGVSKVFPAFFLLVASLVCITTMTRMVEDERTQIGTLKAMGYSNGLIISKYLLYAGSAAVIGCGLGVVVGSIVFPKILWTAYSLILNVRPDIKIVFNVPLCLGVLFTYTVVVLGVTWFCCRMILREVPAELIRPKAPASGKKIFMEYLPFWNKFRFLNKVMFRNIFRYKQRLLMMLVGIGGCTALLVTGFGLGDSIMDIVSYQFEEVSIYDMQVQFREGQSRSQQENFIAAISDRVDSVGFAHQSSVDVDFNDQTKNIYLIASDSKLQEFYNLHSNDRVLNMPGIDEVLLSKGTAESMGISIGDKILIRNSEMQQMTLRVSGIFDNNVYNYAIITPQTYEKNWAERPEEQMAFIKLLDGQDAHQLSTVISDNSDVMSIMISEDLAEQVGSMLEALNMVVATVVICASLLAFIVVYNLTNINISERIREIATIKVLGFNEIESSMYVFKENLLLSVFGAIIGLLGGKFLLEFVMSQIRIDMVWMDARILPVSLVWSVLITLLSACLVDLLLYFKLDKINMAEALKSVE